MDLNIYMVGLIVFVVSIIVGRIILDRGTKELTPEEKVTLMDEFASMRIWNLLPLLLMLIAYVILSAFADIGRKDVSIGLLIAFFVTVFALNSIALRKVKRLNLPGSWRRRYVISKVISLAGTVVFFAFIFWSTIRQ